MGLSVGIECGQRLWLPRSWRGPNMFRTYNGRLLDGTYVRGFAIGPLMFSKVSP